MCTIMLFTRSPLSIRLLYFLKNNSPSLVLCIKIFGNFYPPPYCFYTGNLSFQRLGNTFAFRLVGVHRENEVWDESGYSDVKMHRAHFQLVSNLYSISNYLLLDADECKASLPVCNTNAICQNTPDSYICACKPGVIADGRTCTGKRVCSSLFLENFKLI